MEEKKYTSPFFSQAISEYTQWLGVQPLAKKEILDDLSRDPAGTSDDDNHSDFSGFTKFSITHRPTGYFGRGKCNEQPIRANKDVKGMGQKIETNHVPLIDTKNEKSKSKGVFMSVSREQSPLEIQNQGTAMNNKHGKFDSQPRLAKNQRVDLIDGTGSFDPIIEVSN